MLLPPYIVYRCEIRVAQVTHSPCLDRGEATPSLFHLKGGNPTLEAPPGAVALHTSHPIVMKAILPSKVSETFGIRFLNKSDMPEQPTDP